MYSFPNKGGRHFYTKNYQCIQTEKKKKHTHTEQQQQAQFQLKSFCFTSVVSIHFSRRQNQGM